MKKEKVVEVRITDAAYQKVKELADKSETSVSFIIRQALRAYLDKEAK